MSIIQAIIASSVGSTPKSATWTGIYFDPIQEGQQQIINVSFAYWDNSTVYWTVTDSSGNPITGRLDNYQGTLYPGTGSSSQTINFTFLADANTEGPTSYYVRLGSTSGGDQYINHGPHTCRDSSQTPALILDLDPANYVSGNTWPDTSGLNHNGGIYFVTTSSDSGGVFVWDGTTTQAEVTPLNSSVYSTITLSTWIKPTAVTGVTQTLIAKELCYKLRINNNGTLNMMTGKGYSPWEVTAGADAGLVTAGAWANVVATVDANYTRIYVNGVKVTETTGNVIGANGNAFDIGMYQTTGSPQDLFGGEMGEVKVWNYALTPDDVTTQYNITAARYGLTPIPRSIYYRGSGDTYVEVFGNTSDWNLGSTFTIEAWTKSTNASTNTIRTIVSQGGNTGKIDFAFENGHLLFNNSSLPGIPEPTPGVWTHVAMVGDGSDVFIYYDGQVQGLISGAASLTDGSSTVVVGRRGQGSYQYFYGDLANIQISNVAKYNGTFIPSTTATVTSSTVLLLDSNYSLGPLVDESPQINLNNLTASAYNGDTIYFSTSTYPDLINQIQIGTIVSSVNTTTTATVTGTVFLADSSNWGVPVPGWNFEGPYSFTGCRAHTINATNVTLSTDVPHSITGTLSDGSGGTYGTVVYTFGDPLLTQIQTIPAGASITSNIPGFGIRTVIASQASAYGWAITYDATGLSGTTSQTNQFNYYW